ncbi:MAG TPA: SGNH/GDSL hydrolase family protein [Elusimicrobiota bacterium]|nr:SGNH/GDSL hydrolase family protein [Elusimicrobiota bacterium]
MRHDPLSLRSRVRRWAGVVGLSVAGLAFAVLAVEFLSRRLWPHYALEPMVRTFQMGDNAETRWKPSSVLGWEPLWEMGCRDPSGFMTLHDCRADREPRETRVLLIGDSIAEQLLRCDNLDRIENRLSGAWKRPVKVWTFAGGGYGLNHYEKIVTYKSPPLSVDVLVIHFCLNDLENPNYVVFKKEGSLFMTRRGVAIQTTPVWPALFCRSHLYRMVWIRRNGYRMHPDAYAIGKPSPEEGARLSFEKILETVRQRRGRVLAVIFPYMKPLETYSPTEKEHYRLLREWLDGHGVHYLDLHQAYARADWSAYRKTEAPWDDMHPNERGNQEYLDHILKYLAGQTD